MPADKDSEKNRSPLLELANAMVKMHRGHFGRGPAEAKAMLSDGIAVCLLSDVFTNLERGLIEGGRADHVRVTRMLYQESREEDYRAAAAEALGQPVTMMVSAVHIDPDMVIKIFLLGEEREGQEG